jgi:hypothetical protein
MIDKQQILNDLKEYFDYNGKVTIDDNTGKVSVTGDVYLNEDIKHTKLPVQFGVVGGYFDCINNSLETLTGAPKSVGGFLNCSDNSLETLVGAPISVGGYFDCLNNPFETLTGAPRSVGGKFWCYYDPDLGLLRIILSNCSDINLLNAPDAVTQIIKKYLGKGQSGALAAAAELIRAGYKKNAKL